MIRQTDLLRRPRPSSKRQPLVLIGKEKEFVLNGEKVLARKATGGKVLVYRMVAGRQLNLYTISEYEKYFGKTRYNIYNYGTQRQKFVQESTALGRYKELLAIYASFY